MVSARPGGGLVSELGASRCAPGSTPTPSRSTSSPPSHPVTAPSTTPTKLDASAGYRHDRYELSLALENLTNTAWRESQFAFASRLRDETMPSACTGRTRAVSEAGAFVGCEDIHFTPGAPIAVRASASLYF